MPQRRLLASSLAGLLALVGSPWLDRASLAQAQDGAECEEEAGCEAADAEWEDADTVADSQPGDDVESADDAGDWNDSAQGDEEAFDEETVADETDPVEQDAPAEGDAQFAEEAEESDSEDWGDGDVVADSAEPAQPAAPEPPRPPTPAQPPAPAAAPVAPPPPAAPAAAPPQAFNADAARADLRAFVGRFFRGHPIGDSEDIFATGFVNSMFAMQLVQFCESHFGIEVPGETLELDNFRSINAMVAMIERIQRR